MVRSLGFFAFLCLIFRISAFGQSTAIQECSSRLIVCLSEKDSLYELCTKITPGTCLPKDFTIDWGDGQRETFTLPANLERRHVYDLRQFVKNCDFERIFTVKVRTDCINGDNGAFDITFRNNARANFTIDEICEGRSVNFRNTSCPSGSDMKYVWDFGDGTTSNAAFPSHIFPAGRNNYTVKLTANNNCNVPSTKELNVPVRKTPVASYTATGYTVLNQDTVVCLANGGILTVDGTGSTDASRYQWAITGGPYSFTSNSNTSSPRVSVKFGQAGIYTVMLTATNSCGTSQPIVRRYRVVNTPVIQLPDQSDICQEPFLYRFRSQPGATYTIDGRAFNPDVGENLNFQDTPYTIEVRMPDSCGGTQTKRHTFFVRRPQPVQITAPARNATVCVGSPAILLAADVAGGNWSGSTPALIENRSGQFYFNPRTKGRYVIRYNRGTGPCEVRDSVVINVDGVEVTTGNFSVCPNVPFVKLGGNPTGGTWAATNCSACVIRTDTLLLAGLTASRVELTYTLRNTSGCQASGQTVVTINRPKAAFTIPNGCSGTRIRFLNQSTGASTYRWVVGTQTITDVNPELELPAGTFTVKLVVGEGACADSTTQQVTITSTPSPLKVTANTVSGCSPLRVDFTVEGTQQNDVNYRWDFGDGSNSPFFSPGEHLFVNQTRALKTFRVTMTARNDCGDREVPVDITVKPSPKAEIGVDSTTFRCTPARIRFSNRSIGHDKANSRWFFGNTTPVTSAADTLSWPFSATDSARTYRVQLIVSNECYPDTDFVDIRVFPTQVKALIGLDKAVVCPGETIQFKDATTPKPINWVWTFGDGTTATASNPTHAFSQANASYVVSLTAITECGSNTAQINVRTTQAPTAEFSFTAPFACLDQPVLIENKTSPLNRFEWNFGDGSPVDSVTFSPRHAFRRGERNVVTLTIFGNSKACKTSIQKEITVRPKVEAAFSVTGETVMCGPGAIQLVNASQNANQWVWQFSNGLTSTAQTPNLTFGPGRYDVTLKASYNGVCPDSTFQSGVFTIDSCGLQIPEAFTPNQDGMGDGFTLFGRGIREISKLRIRNRWGEVIFEASHIPAGSQRDGECWDGRYKNKEMPPEMYAFEAEVEFMGGRREQRTGHFYLIR